MRDEFYYRWPDPDPKQANSEGVHRQSRQHLERTKVRAKTTKASASGKSMRDRGLRDDVRPRKSMRAAIIELVVRRPHMSVADITARMRQAGYDCSQ